MVSTDDPSGLSYDEPPVAYEDDGGGWDQLAHDAAQGHEPVELDDRLEYEDEYPGTAVAPGHLGYAEPGEHSAPGAPGSPEEDRRPVPGALEFTDAHDAPPDPEAGRPPLPHQAPPGALDEPAVSEPSGATVEYDVEHAMRNEPDVPAAADDDVLEETPEFLQDTPDHDRLWFEQRPPKDFDFDG